MVIGLARTYRGLRATPVWFSRLSRLFELMAAERPAPRRTDRIAAALAFAIREAVRLEAEQDRLAAGPDSAKVIAMKPKPEARVA